MLLGEARLIVQKQGMRIRELEQQIRELSQRVKVEPDDVEE
jgi:hypothetical protein